MTAMFEFNPEIMGVAVQIVRVRGDEWPYNGIHFSFVLCACARGSKGRSEREGFIQDLSVIFSWIAVELCVGQAIWNQETRSL